MALRRHWMRTGLSWLTIAGVAGAASLATQRHITTTFAREVYPITHIGLLTDGHIAAATASSLYVTIPAAGSVMRLSPSGRVLASFAGTNDQGLQMPHGLTVGLNGSVYVAESFGCAIDKLTPNLTLLARWHMCGTRSEGYDGPVALATGPSGGIYATFRGTSRIEVMTPTGRVVRWINTGGSRMELGGITVARNGTLYTTDLSSHSILTVSRGGRVHPWSHTGVQLKRPGDIAADPAGNLYVVDMGAQQVIKLSPLGHLITGWGDKGTVHVTDASGLSIDPRGTVYVTGAGGVQTISPRGTVAPAWGTAR